MFESIRTERRGNKLHLIDEDGAKDRILATSRDAMPDGFVALAPEVAVGPASSLQLLTALAAAGLPAD